MSVLKVKNERTILISNKTFLDFSEDIFYDLMAEYDQMSDEAMLSLTHLNANITRKWYNKLFDVDLNDDIKEVK